MSDTIVAPHTRDLDELGNQIARWLARQLRGIHNLRIDNLAYPRGAGQSHETILFDASWIELGERRQQGFALRIRPKDFTVFPDILFEEQFRVLRVISDGGYVKVARPYWYEPDPTWIGSAFFVMEKMRGRVPVSVPPYAETGWVAEAAPQQRRRMWESGVRQLAAVQSVPLDKVAFLAGPEHAREGLPQEWDKYERFVRWVQEDRPWPVLDAAMEQLRDRWPDNQPPGLVWGDARIGNMMFDDSFDVLAVMDWEQPSLGGALHDLAWWLVLSELMHGATSDRPHMAGMGTREETIELWQDVTGLSAADIEWYEDFTRLKMSCCGIRMSAMRGVPPPDQEWLAQRLKVEPA